MPSKKKFTKQQVMNLIHYYFLYQGWFPPGTPDAAWEAVTMGDMHFDDPPLPSDPDLQKKRIEVEITAFFTAFGIHIESFMDLLRDNGKTLGDLWKRCYEIQS